MAPKLYSIIATPSPLTPSAANSANMLTTWKAITLGTGDNAVGAVIVTLPPMDSPTGTKGYAFDYLVNTLQAHSTRLTFGERQTALQAQVPLNLTNPMQEARAIHTAITTALFHIPNLTAHGFLDKRGQPVVCDKSPSTRAADITYLSVSSLLTPHLIDHRLHNTAALSVTFFLKLPQQVRPPAPSPSPNGATTTATQAATDAAAKAITDRIAAAEAFISLAKPPQFPASAANSTPSRRVGDPLAGLTPPEFSQLSHAALTILLDADPADAQTPVKARDLFNGIPVQSRAVIAAPPVSNEDRLFTPGANPVFTFVGPASFLNSQTDFDAIFPEPVALTLEPGTITATEGFLHTTHMFQSFVSTAMLQTLISDARLLYVGTRTHTTHTAVVQNTLRRLSALRFHRREPGQLHDWTPNTLFDHYVTESNNLPEDCSTWSSPLTSLFYGNLPEDLATAVTDDPTFAFPPSAQLASKAQQLAQLSVLLTHVNREWCLLNKQTAAFNRICDNRLRTLQRQPGRAPTTVNAGVVDTPSEGTGPPSTPRPPHVLYSPGTSAAEATMRAHGGGQSTFDPTNFDWRTFVLTEEAIQSLTSADLPPRYPGCLGCARLDHSFRGCPNNQDPFYKRRFHMNYAHIKESIARRDQPRPGYPPREERPISAATNTTPPPPAVPPPEPVPSGHTTRPHTDNRPAWVTQKESEEKAARDAISDYHQANSNKRRRNLVFTAHLLQGSTTPPSIRRIPCLVENKLPNINLDIGCVFDDLCITVLYDSCGAISTGYLRYHLWIASLYPETVASLEYFNDADPFEPVMLGGAVTATNGTPAHHGMLSAVISYHTPYRFPDGTEFLLSFALGNEVAVNSLFGWADIRRLCTTLDTASATVTSTELRATFDVLMREPEFDLPAGTTFDATMQTFDRSAFTRSTPQQGTTAAPHPSNPSAHFPPPDQEIAHT